MSQGYYTDPNTGKVRLYRKEIALPANSEDGLGPNAVNMEVVNENSLKAMKQLSQSGQNNRVEQAGTYDPVVDRLMAVLAFLSLIPTALIQMGAIGLVLYYKTSQNVFQWNAGHLLPLFLASIVLAFLGLGPGLSCFNVFWWEPLLKRLATGRIFAILNYVFSMLVACIVVWVWALGVIMFIGLMLMLQIKLSTAPEGTLFLCGGGCVCFACTFTIFVVRTTEYLGCFFEKTLKKREAR